MRAHTAPPSRLQKPPSASQTRTKKVGRSAQSLSHGTPIAATLRSTTDSDQPFFQRHDQIRWRRLRQSSGCHTCTSNKSRCGSNFYSKNTGTCKRYIPLKTKTRQTASPIRSRSDVHSKHRYQPLEAHMLNSAWAPNHTCYSCLKNSRHYPPLSARPTAILLDTVSFNQR